MCDNQYTNRDINNPANSNQTSIHTEAGATPAFGQGEPQQNGCPAAGAYPPPCYGRSACPFMSAPQSAVHYPDGAPVQNGNSSPFADPLDRFTESKSAPGAPAFGTPPVKKKKKAGKIALWVGGSLAACVMLGFSVYGVMAAAGALPQSSASLPADGSQSGDPFGGQLPNQDGGKPDGNQNGGNFNPNNPYYQSGEAIEDSADGSNPYGSQQGGGADGYGQSPYGENGNDSPNGNPFGGIGGVFTGYKA